METESKIFVAGHRGLVGSALVRRLKAHGFDNLITRTREELDLIDAQAVSRFFERERPEYVFLAAAKVGGILANSLYPADFIRDNLTVQLNVIDSSYRVDVKKLLFLGSSCIYPRLASQPIKESYLLTGELEPTNEPYAIAKIAGIKLCQSYNRQYSTNFVSVMPTNLYGPGDNFDLQTSHVLPALIRKFHDAAIENRKEVVVWGSGKPRREFLHVDDMADACIVVMEKHDGSEIINIGCGEDVAIGDLAKIIATEVGFAGSIVFDMSKPDGTPRKLLDVNRLHSLGWAPTLSLREGIRRTYAWYLTTLGAQTTDQLND
ncbi:MAG TPA: GDP-L-fucose synthase [Gemmatimonadaceae bacterium]|nr:GDP-L-fucose synthase [Gemmatimonadaceae bacterium]